MKKVLLLCQFYYPEHVSSAALPAQMAEKLAENGFYVSVVCGYPREYHDGAPVAQAETRNGVHIRRIRYTTFNSKSRIGRIANFFSFFISMMGKLPFIMGQDLVYVYSNPPILPLIPYWAKMLGGPEFIFVGFDLYPDNALALKAIRKGGLIDRLMRHINERVYRHAQKVVAISTDMKHYMLRQYTYLREESVRVIPNWFTGDVGLKAEPAENNRFDFLKENRSFIVSYTGNMGEAQDMDTIADAIDGLNERKENRDIQFIFTGHGNKKERLRERFKEAPNVRFFGFLKGQAYTDMLRISDVCLVSLIKGIEGLAAPSKTYGYFAFGKPVLAIMSKETELGQAIEAFGAGRCIAQGDSQGVVQAIQEYKNGKETCRLAGKAAEALHHEKYRRELSLQKYVGLTKEVLE